MKFISIWIVAICLLNEVLTNTSFPSRIWLYYATDDLPLSIKINYQKIKAYGASAGYQVNLLTQKNYKNYVGTQHINNYNQKSDSQLIKLLALQKGGIYIELSLIPLEDFTWINQIDSSSINVLMFYNDKVPNHPYQTNYYTWFIAANPNSNLIQQWKNVYLQNFYHNDYQTNIDKLIQNNVYTQHQRNSQCDFIDLSLHYLLSIKQKQLDQDKIPLFMRQSVNEFYSILGINCQVGPCVSSSIPTVLEQKLSSSSLTQEQFIKKYAKGNLLKYFYHPSKQQTDFHKWYIGDQQKWKKQKVTIIEKYKKVKSWNSNIKCQQEVYYVEDSIYDKYVLKNKWKTTDPLIVDVQARQNYIKFCNDLNYQQSYPYYKMLAIIIGIFIISLSVILFKTINAQNYSLFGLNLLLINTIKQPPMHIRFQIYISLLLYALINGFLIKKTLQIHTYAQYQKYFLLLIILIVLKLIKLYLKDLIDKNDDNLLLKYTCSVFDAIQTFCYSKCFLGTIQNQPSAVIFKSIIFSFSALIVVRIAQERSKISMNYYCSYFYSLIVEKMKGNYLNILITLTTFFTFLRGLRYIVIRKKYIGQYIKQACQIYIAILLVGVLIQLTFQYIKLKISNRKKSTQSIQYFNKLKVNFDYFKQLFMYFWIIYISFAIKVLMYYAINIPQISMLYETNILLLLFIYSFQKSQSSLQVNFLAEKGNVNKKLKQLQPTQGQNKQVNIFNLLVILFFCVLLSTGKYQFSNYKKVEDSQGSLHFQNALKVLFIVNFTCASFNFIKWITDQIKLYRFKY